LPPPTFTLTWPDYDGDGEAMAMATYVLNGKSLGRGLVGFQRLLDEMRRFPRGSVLRVEFTPHDATGNAAPYYVPLLDKNEFRRVADSRDVRVQFPPIGAGWV